MKARRPHCLADMKLCFQPRERPKKHLAVQNSVGNRGAGGARHPCSCRLQVVTSTGKPQLSGQGMNCTSIYKAIPFSSVARSCGLPNGLRTRLGSGFAARRGMAGKATASGEGKVYFVTGSTDGIGKHTAERLARLTGTTVLVHGRSAEKAEAAAQDISQSTGNQNVEGFHADLSSLSQTRKLAQAVQTKHPSIDVLINNAGVFAQRRQITEDGFELTWAVNVLAPFLLTALLYNNIKERIVNVSSISAGSKIDFDNLQAEKRFSDHGTYSLSKIAMQAFTKELAERKPSSRGPTVNCLDPGTVNTKMLNLGWGPCGMSLKDANYELFLATDPSVAKTHGEYFVSNRSYSMSKQVYDAQVRERLWKILEEQTGQKFP